MLLRSQSQAQVEGCCDAIAYEACRVSNPSRHGIFALNSSGDVRVLCLTMDSVTSRHAHIINNRLFVSSFWTRFQASEVSILVLGNPF
jgi:hypothetical protein